MKVHVDEVNSGFVSRRFSGVMAAIILVAGVSASNSLSAAEEDVAAIIAQELALDTAQTDQLREAMQSFGEQLETLMQEQEAEDADPAKMINGIKQAQEAHHKELEQILGKDKFKQYEAMKEKAIKGIFADLIEIQLMDAQPRTSLSNDQVTKMAEVLGDSKFRLISVAWENAGKDLRPRQKISLARELKGIQRDTRAGIEGILTPEQLQAWDRHKEEMQKK